ncbi:RNA polymerase sigma factor [Paraburkholderia sp.]|uniref:RNA polymerase sigma factor n=1 Tax=Paraburkholderia sp. TaxID=1926495 RepID=UPI0039E6DBA6
MFPRDPDAALIRRIADGDEAAAKMFVTRKLQRVLALAYRICGDQAEAEDVAQDVFVRVWKYARSWKSDDAKVDTWLHRIVLNVCQDRLAASHRRHESGAMELDALADQAPTPEDTAAGQSMRARIWQALLALPVRQREALVLTYYQELSNVEAAAAMQVSVEAVESLLARARRTLKQRLLDIAG